MPQDSSPEDRLTEVVERALRELPLRQAPATLEPRVLAELHRRTALVGWRRGFEAWPPAARVAFVVTSLGLIVLTLVGGEWSTSALASLGDAGSVIVLPAHRAMGLLTTLEDLGRLLVRAFPPGWLLRGALITTVLYAGLFALGTVAYRTLYLKPTRAGELQNND